MDSAEATIDIHKDGTVKTVSSGHTICRLEENHGKLLDLFKREGLQLHASLSCKDVISSPQDTTVTMHVQVTVYGFGRHAPHLKNILSSQSLYLQDPLYPLKDTLYHNPQSLFPEPGMRTTHERFHPSRLSHNVVTTIFEAKNVLANFTTGEDLVETDCCDLITTPLKS